MVPRIRKLYSYMVRLCLMFEIGYYLVFSLLPKQIQLIGCI